MRKDAQQEIIEIHLKQALEALKEIYPTLAINGEHMKNTPKRIAKAWIELFSGCDPMNFEFTTFKIDDLFNSDKWIVMKDIEFSSMCAHHFMPFSGVVHIGYVPSDKICGISKLPRTVEYFSHRPQVQEDLGDEILHFLQGKLRPQKLVVIIESKHTCVACRGAVSRNSTMITTHAFDPKFVKEFLELIK